MKRVLSAVTTLLGLLWISAAQAGPWVDTSDIYLRADIQALADAGVITVPVNTYPLMWAGIGRDLSSVEPDVLSPALAEAFARVNFYYHQAIENKGNARIKLAGASDPARFQHFGSDYREKGQVNASYEYLGERFAVKLSGSANYDPQDNKEFRYDDSYFAVVLGNWIASVGTIPQWWGPGFDSALHRSNNARPMPTISLTRNDSHGFETPWLSWIGPWTFTTGLSMMEKERAVPKTLQWQMRASIRPIRQIEMGVSWTTQFCGEGQECDLSSWWKAISGGTSCMYGEANCGPNDQSKIGNQLAGWDIRYADTLFNVPVGVYLERTCEDSSGNMPWDIADCGYLAGVDSRINYEQQQYKIFAEMTNTMVSCTTPGEFSCFYEHVETYHSGSRYYKRALGSTYDSDAKVYVLGIIGQFQNSRGLTSLFRYAQLNKDGKFALFPEWTPYQPQEDLLMWELSYRMPLLKGMLSLGGSVSKSDYIATDDSKTRATVFTTYEYRF
ncbi:capsule assembly Wzi family protein [Shewanella marina]|uniref:capsule assembly Wzi family protein n=1 Tax=Shewanella marina TaxID=487319 RepID=UPI00046F3009|nr:capsule assembly Wzi family protein [Shewanella marina]